MALAQCGVAEGIGGSAQGTYLPPPSTGGDLATPGVGAALWRGR